MVSLFTIQEGDTNMVCQICGAKSGYYPLCMKHYKAYQRGEVAKCEKCGKWYLKSQGCSECASVGDEDSITIETKAIEQWGKKLFAIAMKGQEWGATDYDLGRYDAILELSKELKTHWDGKSESILRVQREILDDWGKDLLDIANEGLKFSDDSYDIGRYSEVLEVAEDITQELKSYASQENLPTIEDSKESQVRFVANQDIAPALVGMLEKAQDRVLIASPWIWGIKDIVEKLTQLKQERNISVKILVRKPESGKEDLHRQTVRDLWKRGFQVEAEDFLHSKMILVDNKELYIGSANLVQTSLERNLEVGLCTSTPNAVSEALLYFEEAFDEAFSKRF